MRVRSIRPSLAWVVACALLLTPVVASAQIATLPPAAPRPIGEEYRIELSGGMWNPSVFGIVASEQFGITPTDIDFVSDLGYAQKKFADVRLVLRPGKKHKFRVQYTPVSYSADATPTRDLVFNGIRYRATVPISSTFDWKVWRFGYEFDLIYTNRGFFGILVEGRYTQMNASLKSAVNEEYTRAKAPLPALGAVARVYPLKNLSITGEISGFKLPNIDEDYEATYTDIDVYGTFNITHQIGVQGGWRRMKTFLRVETDRGDLRFQGIWFGGAVRF